jgi:hypothetical protein
MRRGTHIHLILDFDGKTLISDETNVFSFILVRNGDVSSIRNEIDSLDDTEFITFNGEVELNDSIDIVLQHPLQRVVVGVVDRFEVSVVDRFSEHVLVD